MKNKTKNIILGVSLGINILLALLVGGALIKSCNDGANKKAIAGYAVGGQEYMSDWYGATWRFNDEVNAVAVYSFSLSFEDPDHEWTSMLVGAGDIEYHDMASGRERTVYNGSWIDPTYQTITIMESSVPVGFNDYIVANAVYQYGGVVNEQSSSEQSSEQTSQSTSEVVSSSEETTEDLSTEQTSATTSEGQPVDSLPSGFTLRFGERNPFSAWAENPKNEDPATGYDSNAPFVLYTGTASSSTMGEVTAKYYRYEVGDFYVAGNPDVVYDTIAITTMNLSPDNYFLYNGGEEATLVGQEAYNKGAFIVANAFYLNSVTNTRVKVLSMGETTAKYGNTEIMALTNPSWANVGFRDIVYIGDNPQIEINGYTARASWWLENNALSSSAAVGSMLLGDATNGVFGLIGQAFSSVASIFGVALIPGLTIGTLLFIPLVVLIILAILRLLAK